MCKVYNTRGGRTTSKFLDTEKVREYLISLCVSPRDEKDRSHKIFTVDIEDIIWLLVIATTLSMILVMWKLGMLWYALALK
jgi:hypothetical protein